MRRSRLLPVFVTLVAAAAALVGVATPAFAGTGHAPPSRAQGSGHHTRPLPKHMFTPYVETYLNDGLSALAQASGAKYPTMAFLQTPEMGSCTVYWNGDTDTPVSWSVYGSDITTIRRAGGDVIASFGGYAADSTGTEIADSCTDVNKIAQQYEKVITTYGISRLDFDIEVNPGGGTAAFPQGSLGNLAGINRRNEAIRIVQDWAHRTHRKIQFVYTLPATAHGLAPDGLNVLQNAVEHRAQVDIVNIMTFDYYDETPAMPSHEMAVSTVTAAEGLQSQLASVYPRKNAQQLWRMTGVTEMIGIDDFGSQETFTTADAETVLEWSRSRHLAELSFWALQRDRGTCPGTGGSNLCSGLAQPPWYFSRVFESFTLHR